MDRNALIGVLFFVLLCLLPAMAKFSRDIKLEQRRNASASIVSQAEFEQDTGGNDVSWHKNLSSDPHDQAP